MEEKSTLRSSVPVQVFSLHFMLVFAYVSAHQEVNIPPEKETNKGNSICCFSHFVTQHTYEASPDHCCTVWVCASLWEEGRGNGEGAFLKTTGASMRKSWKSLGMYNEDSLFWDEMKAEGFSANIPTTTGFFHNHFTSRSWPRCSLARMHNTYMNTFS